MEIRIGKAARQCLESGTMFEHGEEVISLVRVEEGAYVRQDYSKAAWKEELASDAVAVWSTHYHDPKVEQEQPPETFSPLRKIFYTAAESMDRIQLAQAFLAAQLLKRQKVFRLLKESEADDEARVSLYVDKIGGRMVEVRDPGLSYDELESARVALLEDLAALESPGEEGQQTEGDGDAQSEEA